MTGWLSRSQPSSGAFFGSFAKWVVGYLVAWYILGAIWRGERFDFRGAVFIGVFVALTEAVWRYRLPAWRAAVHPAHVLGLSGAVALFVVAQLAMLPDTGGGWGPLRILVVVVVLSMPGYLMVTSLRELARVGPGGR